MDRFRIRGGRRLAGCIRIGGSKNTALPVLAATLLAPGVHVIRNAPRLRDVNSMSRLLEIIGARVERSGADLRIDTSGYDFCEAPYELVKTMRASIYVLGPLLARRGAARVSLPGGCAWGPRPVNFHVDGLRRMGARIDIDRGYISATAGKLSGAEIFFDVPSVGATANLLMAATLAEGETVIKNAAREPEIMYLSGFLRSMGARISGDGTSTVSVEGVNGLTPGEFHVPADRIETGTFMAAGALIGDDAGIRLDGINRDECSAFVEKLAEMGGRLSWSEEGASVTVRPPAGAVSPVRIRTAPYPGFPTDLQAQFMSVLALAEGTSTITDTIYHDRFIHVAELRRLGADIRMQENTALITGRKNFTGADVMATDLRASAALVIAGLVAEGETRIGRVYHIDRGYESIEKKLASLGADIVREKEQL